MIAIHPRTREVHDGSVLTVDHDKCRVQFDRPEIGVEFVMVVGSFKPSTTLTPNYVLHMRFLFNSSLADD